MNENKPANMNENKQINKHRFQIQEVVVMQTLMKFIVFAQFG